MPSIDKNSPKKKGLTPAKVIVIYMIAFSLVFVHELDRIATWAEGLCLEWEAGPRALEYCQRTKDLAARIGVTDLVAVEKTWIGSSQDQPVVGAMGAKKPPPDKSNRLEVSLSRDEKPAPKPTREEVASADKTTTDPQPVHIEGWPTPTTKPQPGQPEEQPAPTSEPQPVQVEDAPAPATEPQPIHIEGWPEPPKEAPVKSTGPKKLRPKKVLIVGDSMILEGFGVALERELKKREGLTVVREGKYSSGLSRPDYFDWNSHLRELIDKHQPDLLVASLGANDPQDILDENRKRHFSATEGWNEIYGSRALELLKIPEDKDIITVWVGLPIMGKQKYGTGIKNINTVVEQECLKVGGCVFVDTWQVLTNDKGKYTTFITKDDGRHVRIRAKDRIHVTEAGGEIMVGHFLAATSDIIDFSPADEGGKVQVELKTFFSKSRNKETSYFAYIPKSSESKPARFPVLYLLHGGWDDYRAWKEHADKKIRELVQKYGLIVVTPDGDPFGWYADSPFDRANQIETFFIKELIPQVEQELPVIPGRRGVCGLSMGGHGAFILSLRNPDAFTSVSSMSGIMDITRHPTQWELSRVFGPFDEENLPNWREHSAFYLSAGHPERLTGLTMKISVSMEDEWSIEDNRLFHQKLEEMGVEHVYNESPGKHDWIYWTGQLPEHISFHAEALKPPASVASQKPPAK